MADTKAQSGENQPDVAWLESQYNVRSYLPDHPKTFEKKVLNFLASLN